MPAPRRDQRVVAHPGGSGPNHQRVVTRHQQSWIPHDLVRAVKTKTIFALTSGRSGTATLAEFLKRNAPRYHVVHEPQNNLWNPGMQGPAIYDHTTGNLAAVRALLRRKRRAINWYRAPTYIETGNAFLKSYWDLAPEFFPQTKVFHLIRDPLQVARSAANRETWAIEHGADRYYRGHDGRRYDWWGLTGLEPIFSHFDLSQITRFQWIFIQWIEIQNRAMEYLQRFDMHARCLTLHTPQDFNSSQAVAAILDFVGVGQEGEVSLPGVHNRTPGRETMVGDDELRLCRDVIAALPATYLEIFRREPYAGQPWAASLSKS